MENNYRVDRKMVVGDWPALAVLLAMFIAGAASYPHLPELVPAHWNLRGEIDSYFSRFWGAFALPLLTGGIYLGMLFAPYIDPKRNNYLRFPEAYRAVRLGLVFFFAALHAMILAVALGGPADLVSRFTPLALGVFLVITGNYLTRVRFNYFFGIRTPWTLASEEVWRRTHRFAGPVFVLAGLVAVVAAFLPAPTNFVLGVGAIIGAAAISAIYSYVIFRRVQG
ncbi:SdpI family protein [Desulfofundulus sp. TPOSR]|uniref:SdpI family protein n=1 Tax=Desulfofundulus sp. TPOSR TaxID=2714340 RepID=UPI0014077C0D|nr:SdpI family protein [Desulfofundulus sp. TPOSR]NHM26475.1 SdpI family protein [Desulfofundulus sp. TPOSR]